MALVSTRVRAATAVAALCALATALAVLFTTSAGAHSWVHRRAMSCAGVAACSCAVLISAALLWQLRSTHATLQLRLLKLRRKRQATSASDDICSATAVSNASSERLTVFAVWEVRYTARMLLLAPLYATMLLPALLTPRVQLAATADQFLNVVEGLIAYTYWSLLVLYAGGYAELRRTWLSFFVGPEETAADVASPLHDALLNSGAAAGFRLNAREVAASFDANAEDGSTADDWTPKKPLLSLARRRWFARHVRLGTLGRRMTLMYFTGMLALLPIAIVCGCLKHDGSGWLEEATAEIHGNTTATVTPTAHVALSSSTPLGAPTNAPTSAYPMYLPGDARFKHSMYPYVFQTRSVLLTPSLLLIVFHIATLSRSRLHGDKSLPAKFVTVKAIVFLSIWQQLGLTLTKFLGGLDSLSSGLLADPDAFPGVSAILQHMGRDGFAEYYVSTFLVALEVLPIAVVSCAVFHPNGLYWASRAMDAMTGNALECGDDDSASDVNGGDEGTDHDGAVSAHAAAMDVAAQGCLLSLSDLVADFRHGWRFDYELPAAR